ncbi:DUF6494 family protein [Lentisalinibacter sediminis]|uniref:DUF6494 family protein n=1 Tax=Lentisalinibacter sediminis TaxID=2992237 RepID=UPI00386C2140
MNDRKIDEERLNVEIRKFLKLVGITSQREIEKAVREALAAGELPETDKLQAKLTLTVPALGLDHVLEHEIHVYEAED